MITVLQGDALIRLRELPDESVQCCVTSPPYWGLRDYGETGQLGLEKTPEEYVAKIVEVFLEVRRVLRKDGTLWLNLGDSYYNYRPGAGQALVKQTVASNGQDLPQECARRGNKQEGLKEKDLVGIPWRVAFALQADGWWLRQDIIWAKPNPMPESVTDRCTKSHEYIFLLTKSDRYYYDSDSILEPAAAATYDRLMQYIDAQAGSNRANGGAKTNGRMKAVGCGRGGGHKPAGVGHTNIATNAQDLYLQRNKRSVWTVATQPYPDAHFATYPPDLIKPCIMAGTKPGDTVLDPFGGSGTTGMVSIELGRKAILIELNPKYTVLIEKRCTTTIGLSL